VFSASLWTGTGVAQNVVNGVDLTAGGMVLTKDRNGAGSWKFFDTVRGANVYLPISTGSSQSLPDSMNTYNNNGFSLGASTGVNTAASTYVGWTFKKAARFFDVIAYTGDGNALKAVPHSLGVTPGLIIVKRRDSAGSPAVSHIQSNPGHQYNLLNDSALPTVNDVTFGGQPSDATNVYLGNNAIVNALGGTYVMWVFAHDPTGIIQCGKYTGNGLVAGPSVSLGWQPQFLFIRRISGGTGNWLILDTARGIPTGPGDMAINPNAATAEVSSDTLDVNATGFTITSTSVTVNASVSDYVYMAIKA
jgi:hypothetical protein